MGPVAARGARGVAGSFLQDLGAGPVGVKDEQCGCPQEGRGAGHRRLLGVVPELAVHLG